MLPASMGADLMQDSMDALGSVREKRMILPGFRYDGIICMRCRFNKDGCCSSLFIALDNIYSSDQTSKSY